MSETLNELEVQVQEMANERTADVLPLLYDRLMAREGLEECPRHSMLRERVKAEIVLHHAKKAVRDGILSSFDICHDRLATRLDSVIQDTEKVREEYRAKTCTCWIQHR